MISCRQVAPLLEAFMDGELAPEKMLDVEQHLVSCEKCLEQVKFSRALCMTVKRSVRDSVRPSPEFRCRVAAVLAAEAARERTWERPSGYDGVSRILPWRVIVPVAAAAAVTLVWAARVNSPVPSVQNEAKEASQPASFASNADQLVDELVSYHARASEPTEREMAAVQRFEPTVGVPLHIPSFREYGARWEGGSVVPLRSQHAALLRYRLGTHRVTLYVYDAKRFPLRATLEPRVVQDMPVYVGTRRGYSIAAAEKRGVGYAAAADLGDSETAELAVASFR
ncbi:zf-HC2 domain-containing protein [Myxococcota bacterium]